MVDPLSYGSKWIGPVFISTFQSNLKNRFVLFSKHVLIVKKNSRENGIIIFQSLENAYGILDFVCNCFFIR